MKLNRLRPWILVLALAAAAPGLDCGASAPPPPPVKMEEPPPAPHHHAAWVPGHWVWRGHAHQYVWLPGHWK